MSLVTTDYAKLEGQVLAVWARTEAEAIAAGYTKRVIATSPLVDIELLVKPDYDQDSVFFAFDTDAAEMLTVRGWMFRFSNAE